MSENNENVEFIEIAREVMGNEYFNDSSEDSSNESTQENQSTEGGEPSSESKELPPTPPKEPEEPKHLKYIESKIKKQVESQYQSQLQQLQEEREQLKQRLEQESNIKTIADFAKARGLSLSDFEKQLDQLQDEEPDQVTTLSQKIAQMEKERQEEKQRLLQQQQQHIAQQKVQELRSGVEEILEKSDIGQQVKALGLQDAVFRKVFEKLKEGNFQKVVNVPGIAQQALEYQKKQWEAANAVFGNVVSGDNVAKEKDQGSSNEPQGGGSSFTLSNGLQNPVHKESRPLTEEELFNQQLKKAAGMLFED